jgi:type II secretory pathway predicted ATPase ExeA
MLRAAAMRQPSEDRSHLTGPQRAAVAKVAYTAGQRDAITLLCGPGGVGKTTVLRVAVNEVLPQGQSVRQVSWTARRADHRGFHGESADGHGQTAETDGSCVPSVLFVDDAHRASAHELSEFVERWRHRHQGTAIVLAGEGRLLSLVAGDARLEQSVRLRATLPPFTLAESCRLLAAAMAIDAADEQDEAVLRTIHEIAGGVPAAAMRLAEMTAMLAASDPGRRLTPEDVETIHRRLSLNAA